MADDLPEFPIVVLEADFPEEIGKVGLYDYLMTVGTTGIVFVAAVPGRLQEWGPVFSAVVQKAANLRAASTLMQMGLINGDTFGFIRQALQLSQADVATLYGVTLATVIAWENNTIVVPLANWACLAYRLSLADGRTLLSEFALNPDFRARRIRVFPNIPLQSLPQPQSPPCPPVTPCLPPRNPLC